VLGSRAPETVRWRDYWTIADEPRCWVASGFDLGVVCSAQVASIGGLPVFFQAVDGAKDRLLVADVKRPRRFDVIGRVANKDRVVSRCDGPGV